ncbi:uncharacterized protein LOC125779392 [Bactrocera dorsalis]|uniref:Uncharacterized protein LOC125779392 n=1 Tax=Bactrocera dorsalis TaxID=27457 RepID=A0ABM3K5D8_BACDO|nr:uncharacterized protein LOC125779392 [Bactrocera dorsalis]
MSNQEDIKFLSYQRMKGRPGHMEGIDVNTALAEQRREAKAEEWRWRQISPVSAENVRDISLSSESEVEEITSDEVFTDDEKASKAETASKKRKYSRGYKEVMTEKLSILLDRCKISDRNAVRIIFATAESLGCNVEEFALSRSALRKRRISFRSQRAQKIKTRFKNLDLEGIVVHWDGKLLANLFQKECAERLAALVSKGDCEQQQLLGVPELENSTGASQAEAVSGSLKEWDIGDKIVGMCFDTTASNTGRMKGACTLLEKQLGKSLLYLACRHHILEVVLRSVFEYKMGSTTAPQRDIFRRFQIHWPNIDQSKYIEGV